MRRARCRRVVFESDFCPIGEVALALHLKFFVFFSLFLSCGVEIGCPFELFSSFHVWTLCLRT